ncbi:MAG: CPBP family intramembrane metalloprotease [Myxococcota bacterium]|nr:CPBP family intramembrane metalloprotease [Myxococcota bacterium]
MQDLPTTPPIVSLVVLTLLAAALVIATTGLGPRQFRAFLVDVERDGERARLRHFRSWMAQSWAWAIATVGLVLLLPGVGLEQLGLREPAWVWRASSSSGSLVGGMIAGTLIGAIIATIAQRRRRPQGLVPAAVQAMLPTSRRGRWTWSALSITAGITEEITYRGLLVLVLAALVPDLATGGVVAVCAVLFALAHTYQGRAGVVATGILGAIFTLAYLGTGSLVLPIVLHSLVDLRALLFAPPTPSAPPEPA